MGIMVSETSGADKYDHIKMLCENLGTFATGSLGIACLSEIVSARAIN